MDFQYNFRQAHQDRLEDAGVKSYNRQPREGYIIENRKEKTYKKLVERSRQLVIAVVNLLVK